MKRIFMFLTVCMLVATAVVGFALTEDDYYTSEADLPTELVKVLPEQHQFVDGLTIDGYAYLLLEANDSNRRILIYSRTNDSYTLLCESAPMSQWKGNTVDIQMSNPNAIDICYQGYWYGTYENNGAGEWILRRMTAAQKTDILFSDVFGMITYDASGQRLTTYPGNLEITLVSTDVSELPVSFEEMITRQDTTGYAKVSITDPAKRLNLRAAPSVEANSIGRYYNGTPVKVLSVSDGWAKVSIAGVTGYVDNGALAYGEKMLSVNNAFPNFDVNHVAFDTGLSLYAAPSSSSDVVGVISSAEYTKHEIIVIGVANDEWYHVVCIDDKVGYIEASRFR